jgi:hypothetical protein
MHGVESGLAELGSGRFDHEESRFRRVMETNIAAEGSQPPQYTLSKLF